MNRTLKSFAVSFLAASVTAAVLILGVGQGKVMARYFHSTTATTSTTPDQWCQGQYSDTSIPSEVCIDYNTNFIPTVNNNQTLGNTTYKWKNIYATAITAGTITAGTGGIVNTGPVGLTVQTTTQIAVRTDPVGSTFLVQYYSGNATTFLPGLALCTSTSTQAGSYIFVSTITAANIGAICK